MCRCRQVERLQTIWLRPFVFAGHSCAARPKPPLGWVRKKEQDGYRADEPADEYMEHLLESFRTLKEKFGDDAEAVRIIDRELDLAKDWINDNESARPDRAPRLLGTAGHVDKPHGTRSIFDDVDT